MADPASLTFDDLVPPKPAAGATYGPGAAESGQTATPEQQAYAKANGRTVNDPDTLGKTPDNPAYDTATATGDPSIYHVSPAGQLSDPDAHVNLTFDDLVPKKIAAGDDAYRASVSGLERGAAGLLDSVGSFVPGLNVLEHVSSANPLGETTLQHGPTGHFARTALKVFTGGDSEYQPQTEAGRYLQTAGEFAPAALAPGSAGARVLNVALPAIGSETAGEVANALHAPAWLENGARVAGAVLGGGAASARFNPATSLPDDAAANALVKRAGADPEQMATRANALRASGVDPTLLDVSGQKGLRLLRAVGVTNDNAGETLQQNALTVGSTTKPAVMAQTRGLTGEPRTADQLASDLDTARSAEARTTYEAPYAASIDLKDPNVIQALRDPEGASAINRAITAARARMDYKAMADLQALKATADGPTGDGQVWPTTGRALDRVQIAFGNKGAALAQNGSNDIASGMFKRQDLINGALDQVDGLQPARDAYRAKSQAIDILQTPGARKDPFSTDPTDYKAWVDSLPPEAQHANQVAIRQDILDTLGGQRAGTAGSIDELATSQYAKQNLAAALGDKEAGDYLGNLSARLAQRSNASFANPNGGSRTAVLQNDAGNALGRAVSAADTVHKVATGNVVGLAAKAAAWLKTRGLSDSDATALADASVDPSRLDGVISAIRQIKDPETAQGFVNFRGGLLGAARGVTQSQLQPAPQ